MRALAVAAFAPIALIVVACAAPEPQAQATPPATETAAAVTPTTPPPPPILDPAIAPPLARENTSTIPVRARGAINPSAAPSIATPLPLDCAGAFAQGGTAICRTVPNASIVLDGQDRGKADDNGWFVIGFDRDSPATSHLEVIGAEGMNGQRDFSVLPREFSIQRVDGLPPQTVTPTDPAIVARLARDRETKNRGFASRAVAEGWLDGFVWPVEGRISGSWGNQRVLNGEPRSPHYGVDIAMPEGTPIHAPAGGVIALAEPDLYLEGGLVLIDHGQGLISMYLHMSRLDVRAGDTITQGQVIGAVGKAGRATGAHLCWRMKWRDRNLDPSLAILGLAQARVQLAGVTP